MSGDGSFEVGDRVTRRVDVFNPKSPLMRGTVAERYSQDGGLRDVRWHDPEVYAVVWDGRGIERGYFRHGLNPARSASPVDTGRAATTTEKP